MIPDPATEAERLVAERRSAAYRMYGYLQTVRDYFELEARDELVLDHICDSEDPEVCMEGGCEGVGIFLTDLEVLYEWIAEIDE